MHASKVSAAASAVQQVPQTKPPKQAKPVEPPQQAQPPKPVVNTQGHVTGTHVNTKA